MSTEPRPGPGTRAGVAFVLVTVLLDVMALGITIPVLPRLVEGMLGGDTAQAATVFGLFSTSWALMQIAASPVLGALSDRFGRRPVLLISTLGLGADYIMMALAPTIAWLLAGRIINGACAATFSTATAYIADITPPEERARRFGLIGAAFGAGFVLGPAIGGLLGSADPRLPFWVAAACSLANTLYGYFVLPESLPPEPRPAFSLKRANPIGALRLLGSHPDLKRLAATMFLFHLAHTLLPALFVLYVGYRYGWTERAVGLALAGFGVLAGIVQAGLIRPAVARFGERAMLLFGLSAGAAGLLLCGLAGNSAAFVAGMVLIGLWGFVGPSAQGMMTRLVPASAQGRLQGAAASLMGLAGVLGPGLFTTTFALAIADGRATKLPGAPFVVAAAILLAAIAIATRAAPLAEGARGG